MIRVRALRNGRSAARREGADLAFTYDPLNQLTNMVSVGLFTNSYVYDAAHMLLSEDGPWANDTVFYTNVDRLRTGLMLQHFLTGDERYRDAVLGLAEWVLAMDNGNATVFRWLSRGDTGLPTATTTPDYHGPGRGAAYSITTLLNGPSGR